MGKEKGIYERLDEALMVYSRRDLAAALEINTSTLSRWVARETEPRPYVVDRLQQMLPFQNKREPGEFTFIDLFAGIGGMRQAFENVGGECVFTSEWDSYCQRTYMANHGDRHPVEGDITKFDEKSIPAHDVLLAGFPCQPFSLAGVSKKNSLGRQHGFKCDIQGTLFFDVARIIKEKRPKAFLLENVKNLRSHDRGKTFELIRRTLEEDLGYQVEARLLDAQHVVPQHRERIAIVGFREPTPLTIDALQLPEKGTHRIGDILHREHGNEPYLHWDGNRFFDYETNTVPEKYGLSDNLWRYLKEYKEKHQRAGNGFGYGLVGPNDVARTLSARYHKDGSEILVERRGRTPRRLTPRECARLMGFPDSFHIPVSDTRAYQQFGNALVVPLFTEVAKLMKPWIVQDKDAPQIGDLLTGIPLRSVDREKLPD